MKLSVFTVCTPDLEPEALASAAKAAGIEGIEWRFKDTPAELRKEAYSFWGNNLATMSPSGGETDWARFKAAAAQQGLRNVSVTPYLKAGELEATEQVLKAARYMEASMIRLGVSGYDRSRPFGELFEETRSYLKEAAALCRQYGVKGLVETHHNTIAPSASAAMRLVEGLDPDAVGVLYDPGNMVHEGYEQYRMGMELLGPYLAHVHIKNAGWKKSPNWTCGWVGLESGIVPLQVVIDDLRAVGYDGYLGLEDFSGELDSLTLLQQYAAMMQTLLRK